MSCRAAIWVEESSTTKEFLLLLKRNIDKNLSQLEKLQKGETMERKQNKMAASQVEKKTFVRFENKQKIIYRHLNISSFLTKDD